MIQLEILRALCKIVNVTMVNFVIVEDMKFEETFLYINISPFPRVKL